VKLASGTTQVIVGGLVAELADVLRDVPNMMG
jgi:hypothetical protein